MVVTPELLLIAALIVAVPVFETNPAMPWVPVVEIVIGTEFAMVTEELRLTRIASLEDEVLLPTVMVDDVPPEIELIVIAAALMGAKVKVTLLAKVMGPVKTLVAEPLVAIEYPVTLNVRVFAV
jgi:hypothetical protein